jgi:hypothetical protein
MTAQTGKSVLLTYFLQKREITFAFFVEQAFSVNHTQPIAREDLIGL